MTKCKVLDMNKVFQYVAMKEYRDRLQFRFTSIACCDDDCWCEPRFRPLESLDFKKQLKLHTLQHILDALLKDIGATEEQIEAAVKDD